MSDGSRNYKILQNNHERTGWKAYSTTAAAQACLRRTKLQHSDSLQVDSDFAQNWNKVIHEVVTKIEKGKVIQG